MHDIANKNNVTFVLPNAHLGGAERVLVTIANAAAAEKFTVTIILLKAEGPLLEHISNDIQIIDLKVTKTRFGLYKLIKALRNGSAQIIISTTCRMNFLTLLAAKLTFRKLLVIAREPNNPAKTHQNTGKIVLAAYKFLYKSAHRIIAQTPEMKQSIHKFYGVKNNNIIFAQNPVDSQKIKYQASITKNPYSNYAYTFIFVAIGRLAIQKRYDLMLKAFSQAFRAEDSVGLFILGKGPLLSDLQELSLKLKINKKVNFLGQVPNPYPYIKWANSLCSSSDYEGFPNTIIEASVLGTPVITTESTPYLVDFVRKTKMGTTVPCNNCQALSNELQKFTKNLPKFEPSNYTFQFKELLEQIV